MCLDVVLPSPFKVHLSYSRRTYDALIGIVTHDFFDELSDSQLRRGMSIQQRDKMFQTFVRNQYNAHLQEILLTLQNEYTDWEQSVQHPSNIKEQVGIFFFYGSINQNAKHGLQVGLLFKRK